MDNQVVDLSDVPSDVSLVGYYSQKPAHNPHKPSFWRYREWACGIQHSGSTWTYNHTMDNQTVAYLLEGDTEKTGNLQY